jgi:broad specificity phosphatase PhoE
VSAVRVRLVRHGRATAGWDADPDPGLDDLGRAQAEAVAARLATPGDPLPIVVSPLRRCRETAAPLAARWAVLPVVDAAVAEIPSPEGVPFGQRVPWLRDAMQGTWSALGPRYVAYRDGVAARVAACFTDTVIVSHFVAINAVIGACVGDDRLVIASLDNCSCTVVEVAAGGRLRLVETGDEADTLIR